MVKKSILDRPTIWSHVWFSLLLILVGSIAIVALHVSNQNRLRDLSIEDESGKLQLLTKNLEDFYRPLVRNIEFLASRPLTREVLCGKAKPDALEREFALISSAIQGYDQIRLLDLDGKEIIRVNLAGKIASVVDQSQLQDKSKRDYFKAVRKLAPDETYIGPIDLNQEMNRLEIPYKQVIRCAKHVVDEEERPIGVVIINYLGHEFLPNSENSTTHPHRVLVAEDGSFIQGPSRYPKFARLVESEPPNRFDHFFPLSWESMTTGPDSQQIETPKGWFISQAIRPHADTNTTSATMYLISIIPRDSVELGNHSWWITAVLPMIGWWLVVGMLGIAVANRDEQSRLARQQEAIATHLSVQAEELRTSNEELEQFAFIASHDLQEPLRKICTLGDLLLDEGHKGLSPDGFRYIEIMVESSARMRMLIEGLLEYSRVESRQRELGPVESQQAFQDAIDNLSQVIDESDATIRLPNDLPRVIGDQGLLIRLFQNLIGNAIKYSDKQPEIEVNSVLEGKLWRFSVIDNGIGVDAEYHESIFKVFKRLHTHSDYEGTGIGLSVCRRIVGHMGGKIWIESGKNGGSILHFTVPAA